MDVVKESWVHEGYLSLCRISTHFNSLDTTLPAEKKEKSLLLEIVLLLVIILVVVVLQTFCISPFMT